MKNKASLKSLWKERYLYSMIVPVIVYYLIFHYVPMYGIVIAFQDYNIFRGPFQSEWVGFENFIDIFDSPQFFSVLRNTFTLNFLNLVVGFPAPIVLALMLNEVIHSRFKRSVQSILYLPHFLSGVVMVGIAINIFSLDRGPINQMLLSMGLGRIPFLTSNGWWIFTYLALFMWKSAGWGTIIYLAALSSIDPSLYESAVIDGANRWKQMLYITLPGIKSTIIILFIMRVGRIIDIGFEVPYLLGNVKVMEVSDVISTYIYREGITKASFSFATAVGIFQSLVGFALVISTNALAKWLKEDGLW